MTVTQMPPQAATRHAAVAAGLNAAAAFVTDHPDLPLAGGDNPLLVSVYGGTDEENRAEVDRIAGILGVTAHCRPGIPSHYRAVARFGGGVMYSAEAISSDWMDRYTAAQSYRGSVQPEAGAA